MRVFLAGGSGVVGRPLVARLIQAGHHVVATTRSETAAGDLARLGAQPVAVDALDREAMIAAVTAASPEVVIHQLTSIPPRIHPRRVARDLATTNRLRIEGTRHLAEAARTAGARRLVAQSVSFAYRPKASGLHAESDPLYLDAPPAARPLIEAVAQLERRTTGEPGLEGVVLRYGFLYGPGTVYGPGGSFLEDLRRRRVPIVRPGTGVFSLLHVDDAASAAVAALTGPPGIYNIVDDEPTPAADFLTTFAEIAEAPRPMSVPRWLGRLAAGPYGIYLMVEQRGASNAKARGELGWVPGRPSWRTSFRAMLAP